MINRHEHNGLTWIDLESPTTDDIAEISQEFSIGPILEEELLTPTAKPRVDVYAECAYAVFHFPAIRHTREKELTQEVDVILGKKHLITVHYGPMNAIDDFKRAFEAEELLERHSKKLNIGHILFELAGRLYRESEDELAALEDTIEDIEGRIFSGEEKKMVTAISKAGRELLAHKRVLGNHTETLEQLEQVGVELMGENMRTFFRGITSLHYRVYNHALMMADMLDELRDTNTALLSTRQNEIMKNLTIMAFVTFPLSVIAGIFGMNTTSTPIVGQPYDFIIIVFGMGLLTFLFFLYFKARNWF